MPQQTSYTFASPLGKLRITQGRDRRWRLYAGDDFLGSFSTAQEAAEAAPPEWKAPADLAGWAMAIG